MAGYFKSIKRVGKILFPSLLWDIPATPKTVYLTFDDGPTPGVTPWVLALLKKYHAKATFFCIGKNITENPEIFQQILAEGHAIGNHSHNHLNGWKTSTDIYVRNVTLAEEAIVQGISAYQMQKASVGSEDEFARSQNPQPSRQPSLKLFRPPYGRIRPSQFNELQKLDYKIVMWDVISGDFDEKVSAERCYENVVKCSNPGSIVVFHDSEKASVNLKQTLPEVLKFYSEKGFDFKSL